MHCFLGDSISKKNQSSVASHHCFSYNDYYMILWILSAKIIFLLLRERFKKGLLFLPYIILESFVELQNVKLEGGSQTWRNIVSFVCLEKSEKFYYFPQSPC